MKTRRRALLAASACALVCRSPAAGACTYRCVGTDGKKYYGSEPCRRQCLSAMPVEQLNAQGMVTQALRRRRPPPPSARRRRPRRTSARSARAITKEEGRRNRALLATYTSEKDIDSARARALEDNEVAVTGHRQRIGSARRSASATLTEGARLLFQGKNKPPAKLADDIRNTEFDITRRRKS